VEAVAEGDTVTVFLRSQTLWPFKHNDAHWDDAYLRVVEEPPAPSPPQRGAPREQYARTYLLLPPDAGGAWAKAAVDGVWETYRFTVGGSADDAGIGDLDQRRVVAINPHEWSDDLEAFFEVHYPGVEFSEVSAESPEELVWRLREGMGGRILLCQGDEPWGPMRYAQGRCHTFETRGCWIACCAMAQRWFEIDPNATPLTVDETVGDGGYNAECEMYHAAMPDLGLRVVGGSADDENAAAHLDGGGVCFAEVSPAAFQHFVFVPYHEDGRFWMYDPWLCESSWLDEHYDGVDSWRFVDEVLDPPPLPPPPSPPSAEPPPQEWASENYLTLHHQAGTAKAGDFVRDVKPPYVKIFGIGDRKWVWQASPETRILWRRWADDQIHRYLSIPAEQAVQEWLDLVGADLRAVAGDFSAERPLFLESPLNEVLGGDPARYASVVAFEELYARELRAQFPYCRAVCLLIAVGNPPGGTAEFRNLVEMTVPVAEAVYETGGALGYHAYYGASPAQDFFGATYPDVPGRWERMDAVYRSHGVYPLWLLGEGGVCASTDGYDLHWGEGWKGSMCMDDDTQRYVSSLMQYQERIEAWNALHANRCGGVALFTSPGGGGWATFGLAGDDLVEIARALVTRE
jgi:hypothetical protein